MIVRPIGQAKGPRLQRTRPVLLGVAGIVLLGIIWEVYKAVAPAKGVVIGGITVLPRSTDLAMPHLITMWNRLGQPVLGDPTSPPLWQAVFAAAGFTLGLAALSWLLGVVVGLVLAVVMQRFRTAESALLPWIILSQTVPIIALAPLVSGVGSQIPGWQDWMSVVAIASYLAFFPVSVGALRGLESPEQAHVELMYSYGAGWWKTLTRLRLPASIPYLLSALRLAAASAVIGAVVAEVSIGLEGGVGRMMIEFASASSGDPGKAWAPIFGGIAIGLIAAGVIALFGLALKKYRRGEVTV